MTPFGRAQAYGVRVAVKAQPRSRRPGTIGRAGLGQGPWVGISKPPEDVRATPADAAGGLTSAVNLISGQTSRGKTLHNAADPTPIIARLEAL